MGGKLSFGELNRAAGSFAAVLAGLGLKPGSREMCIRDSSTFRQSSD